MAAPWSYYPKPKWDLEKPTENGFPYVVEMFGELYFTENPPKPVTMSELFGDYPKAPLPPKVKNDTSDNNDDEGGVEDKIVPKDDAPVLVEEKIVPKDDAAVVVESQTSPKPRRRLMTRASLYKYVPPVNKEPKVYPPVIHALRPMYIGNPLFKPSCDENCWCARQENNAVAKGGSSSSVGKEELAEEKADNGKGGEEEKMSHVV